MVEACMVAWEIGYGICTVAGCWVHASLWREVIGWADGLVDGRRGSHTVYIDEA